MRVEKLQVNGFGHLNGLNIELPGPVTVLYGPNEAGKSTLLGFVRAMLFGIPTRANTAERYEPVGGGVHGGTLTILGDDGARWLIERYAQPPEGRSLPGTRGDRLRIVRTDTEGTVQEMSQEDMQRQLLGGISRAMFKQLFAVSLTELQEVGALQSEELSRFLFHAGIGGGAAVLRGEKKLIQDMDKLYRPRGRNQEIAQMLHEVERLEREVEAAKALLPRYNDVLEQLEVAASQLAECEAKRTACSREAALLQKAAAVRGDWLHRETLLAELAALPRHERFPEQGIARWQSLQAEKERLLLERSEWERRREALEAELAALKPREAVLEQEAVLRELARRLPAYEARQRELADLVAEAAQLQGRLAQCLRSIHPDWRADDLRAFAGTVGEQESVRRYASRFAAYDKEMELLRSERYKLERAIAAAQAALEAAAARATDSLAASRQPFAALIPKRREDIRALWDEIRSELDRWRDIIASRQSETSAADAEKLALTRMRSLYRKLFAGSVVLTVTLPAALWMTTRSAISASFIGVILLGLDLYLGLGAYKHEPEFGQRTRSSRRSRGELSVPGNSGMEAQLQTLLGRLIQHPLTAATAFGEGRVAGGLPLEAVTWDEEERQLRRLMENWLLWDQRQEALEAEAASRRNQATDLQDELRSLERELNRRESSFAELAAEWEGWLKERKLSPELSPEAVMDVFRLAEQGREWQGRIDAFIAKMNSIRAENDSFKRDCLAVASNLPSQLASELVARENVKSAGDAPDDPLHILRSALAELEQELGQLAKYERAEARLLPLKEEGQRLDDRLQQVAQSQQALLAEGQAASGEELLRMGANVARRETLEQELRHLELAVFSGLEETRRSELERLLHNRDEAELERLLKQANAAYEEADTRWRELQEMRGRLLQEQESLEARCKQEDLKQQLEEQKASLAESVDKYAVMAVCRELIARVRRIYEEERQPAVLQTASGYFDQMTGGMYRRIVMKMGSQELMAEHAVHGPIESSQLSRGTAEQLYLSMRLALSEAVVGQGRLPLLLDDLFVNFDATRLEGALSVLKAVSSHQQIVMMTCHEHVVRRVLDQLPGAQIVELGQQSV
ncbi:AAA family ATPase [Paenibacillus puldeungensis]|uniref:AAA family ATPase n=1 Tax=Paenibacillus puldeungensis TaxID=696536 RepID=A0ABW3RXS2_9BACL